MLSTTCSCPSLKDIMPTVITLLNYVHINNLFYEKNTVRCAFKQCIFLKGEILADRLNVLGINP